MYQSCATSLMLYNLLSDIFDVTGVSVKTVKMMYKLLHPWAVQLFPADVAFTALPANLFEYDSASFWWLCVLD